MGEGKHNHDWVQCISLVNIKEELHIKFNTTFN